MADIIAIKPSLISYARMLQEKFSPTPDTRPCVACHEPIGAGAWEHEVFTLAPICDGCADALGLKAEVQSNA